MQVFIDYLGTILMIIGLTSLLLAITQIGQGHYWRDGQVPGLLAGAVVALTVFVWRSCC